MQSALFIVVNLICDIHWSLFGAMGRFGWVPQSDISMRGRIGAGGTVRLQKNTNSYAL
jgi:hypothetical protein